MERVNVLAVIRRHAESHRAMAETDAYSAQEAPRLEAALSAVAELIEAAREYRDTTTAAPHIGARFDAALARVGAA